MRLSIMMRVVVSGYGMHSSMVAHRFKSEICTVWWVDEETDEQWVTVKDSKGSEYTVHTVQCTPIPQEKI